MRSVVCVVVLMGLLSACSESKPPAPASTPSAATTATATPTPPSPTGTFVVRAPEPCPVEATLCEIAVSVQAALAGADFGAIQSMASPRLYTCPGGTPGGAGGPYPLCDGASAGEARRGFPAHYLNSEGVVEASLLPSLRAGILRGVNGVLGPYADEPRIVGFHCPLEGDEPNCEEQVVVYFEGSPHIGLQAESGGFKIGWLQFGDFAEDQSVFVHGGDLTFAHDTAGPGRYMAWRTANTPDPGNLVRERWLFAPVEVSGLDVTPGEGNCPATLRLNAPAARALVDPKGPAIVDAHVFRGVVAIDTTIADRNVPRAEIPAVPVPGTDAYEITLEPSMLNGALCEPGVLTVISGGALGWLSSGYRVTGP